MTTKSESDAGIVGHQSYCKECRDVTCYIYSEIDKSWVCSECCHHTIERKGQTGMKASIDGDCLCLTGCDFENLQASPAYFIKLTDSQIRDIERFAMHVSMTDKKEVVKQENNPKTVGFVDTRENPQEHKMRPDEHILSDESLMIDLTKSNTMPHHTEILLDIRRLLMNRQQ